MNMKIVYIKVYDIIYIPYQSGFIVGTKFKSVEMFERESQQRELTCNGDLTGAAGLFTRN